MKKKTNCEQLSIFELLVEDQEDILEAVCMQGSGFEGGRIRIYAMLTSGRWPQYREKWLADEFGTGGYSIIRRPGWFCDFNGRAVTMTHLRDRLSYTASWRQLAIMTLRLIDTGDYLTRAEEREFGQIVQQHNGRIPYPRPRAKYPECAWEETEMGLTLAAD